MCGSHLAHLTSSIDAIRSLLLEKASLKERWLTRGPKMGDRDTTPNPPKWFKSVCFWPMAEGFNCFWKWVCQEVPLRVRSCNGNPSKIDLQATGWTSSKAGAVLQKLAIPLQLLCSGRYEYIMHAYMYYTVYIYHIYIWYVYIVINQIYIKYYQIISSHPPLGPNLGSHSGGGGNPTKEKRCLLHRQASHRPHIPLHWHILCNLQHTFRTRHQS